ncbi:MAG: cupredoxin domain-containing protein [Candidatus Limnocylindria bacterium]
MLRFRQLGALAALALLVAACSTTASNTPTPPASQGASAAPRVVQIEIGDGVITPATVTVTKGETVKFEVKNVNTVEVELIVGLKADVDADSGDSLVEAEHIAAGASSSLTFTFDGDGPYAYGDQIDDHYSKGAKGDIVLQ